MTSEQVKAARGLLRWSQMDLADASGVSHPTIKRIEAVPGELTGYDSTGEKIRSALEGAGIIFIESNGQGPGVRMREPGE